MKSLASDGEREVNKMPRYRVGRFPSLKGLIWIRRDKEYNATRYQDIYKRQLIYATAQGSSLSD